MSTYPQKERDAWVEAHVACNEPAQRRRAFDTELAYACMFRISDDDPRVQTLRARRVQAHVDLEAALKRAHELREVLLAAEEHWRQDYDQHKAQAEARARCSL